MNRFFSLNHQTHVGVKGLVVVAALSLLAGTSSLAQVIDTFDSTLSTAYTKTTVLDNDATRNVTFATSSGILQSTATTTTAAEQSLLLRSDFILTIGQTLRADFPATVTSSQDFGIAVGTNAAPTGVAAGATGDVRAGTGGYVFVGLRFQGTAQYVSGGYNTTATLATNQAALPTGIAGFYITRAAANVFNVGYSTSTGVDTQITSYTLTNTTIGNAVGFYSDMRAAGTIGNFDNLRIVPEPSTWAMLVAGVGLLGASVLRRRLLPV